MHVDHWMMFSTFAEQRHFVYPNKDTYNGVLINANMAAHAPSGLAAFLMEKTVDLPYIIDPMTHAFQHDPSFIMNNNGEIKSSLATLCKAYGEPVSSSAGHRPLLPNDFSDEALLRDFVKRCIYFQQNQLSSPMENSDANKYLGQTSEDLQPNALIPPYFYMTETTLGHWLPIGIKAAKMALEFNGESKIFVSIVVTQGVILNEDAIKKIIDGFSELDVSGFLIWVDELNEHKAGSAELRGLLKLARGLRKGKKREVINLHGGYFSVLAAGNLGDSVMTGVAHGPEFGEHRSVVPVGGGIPIAKYYIPDLHARIKYRDAVSIFREKGCLESADLFHQTVCNCDECRKVIDGNIDNFILFGDATVTNVKRGHGIVRMEFPTGDTKQRCLRHYLERKALEYHNASNKSKIELIEDLRHGREIYQEIIGLEEVTHLELWENVLSE